MPPIDLISVEQKQWTLICLGPNIWTAPRPRCRKIWKNNFVPNLLILQVLWLCELVKLTLFTPSSAIRKVAHPVPKAFTSKERMTLETLARRPRFVQCKFCSTTALKLSACPIKECPDSCLTCTSSTKCDVVMIIRFPFHVPSFIMSHQGQIPQYLHRWLSTCDNHLSLPLHFLYFCLIWGSSCKVAWLISVFSTRWERGAFPFLGER